MNKRDYYDMTLVIKNNFLHMAKGVSLSRTKTQQSVT